MKTGESSEEYRYFEKEDYLARWIELTEHLEIDKPPKNTKRRRQN
jgi:hypothetical protein